MTASRPRPFTKRIYDVLIEPRQTEQVARNREYVFNVVLLGVGSLMAVLSLLLIQSFVVGNDVLLRMVIGLVGAGLCAGLGYASRRGYYRLAAYCLVAFFCLLAVGAVVSWGIGTPMSLLLLGMAMILGGTILGARFAWAGAVLAAIVILGVQISLELGWYRLSAQVPSDGTLADAIAEAVIMLVIGLIGWLFIRETERSLRRAEAAEAALAEEKAALEVRVSERTAALHQAQFEEMQQLHQFAEVGQLSTALLHDLANHLSVLTLDIEGLRQKQHDERLARSQAVVGQLNDMLAAVRSRAGNQAVRQPYNLLDGVDQTLAMLMVKDMAGAAAIDWQPPSDRAPYHVKGDPLKWQQILTILLTNALEATADIKRPAKVGITLAANPTDAYIECIVTDNGKGISESLRKRLFKRSVTSKSHGMGIGLYLAQRMVESEFGGSLALGSRSQPTSFIIQLPYDDPIAY